MNYLPQATENNIRVISIFLHKIHRDIPSQGALPVSTTQVASLLLVSRTPLIKVSTGTTRVIGTSAKLPPVSTTPAVNK
jgi:hypothetical protein